MTRKLTGTHVLAIFVLGFGTIISVNVALAVNAVRTFPGLEVANSYVASQSWEARRRAQDALGWSVDLRVDGPRVTVALRDDAGRALPARAVIGRATSRADEQTMRDDGSGSLVAEVAPGRWRIDLAAEAPDGTPFRRHLTVQVAQ